MDWSLIAEWSGWIVVKAYKALSFFAFIYVVSVVAGNGVAHGWKSGRGK